MRSRLLATIGLSVPLLLTAQQFAAQSSAPNPAFDVATVKISNADHTARSHIISSDHDGRFTAINEPLGMLLSYAFDVPESQIIGIPSQLTSLKFDIQARSDPAVDTRLAALSWDKGKAQKHKMLQALFADRFKLTTHRETRTLPAYTLGVAKKGSNLQASQENGKTLNTNRGRLDLKGVPLTILAEELAKQLGRPVEDKTGISGRFDIMLKWTPDDQPNTASDAPPNIFTAIQEQLGLKLESVKAPTDILVIDHVEMPSSN